MAKKKEITINLNGTRSGDTPTPGDVNIFYGHDLLVGLSETGNARLETENTIVIKDIAIEYTKPTPEPLTISLYTQVERGTPVFVKDISGIPGSAVNETITTPEGAVTFKRVNANWRISIDGANTVIIGYIPAEFTENVTIEYDN